MHKLIGLYSNSPQVIILTIRISRESFILLQSKDTTTLWPTSLITLVKKRSEVVRDAWLFENLVHADTCRLSSWSFSKGLQSGLLKIHWKITLGITLGNRSSIWFWKLKWYLSVFHVFSKISALSVVFTVKDWPGNKLTGGSWVIF